MFDQPQLSILKVEVLLSHAVFNTSFPTTSNRLGNIPSIEKHYILSSFALNPKATTANRYLCGSGERNGVQRRTR